MLRTKLLPCTELREAAISTARLLTGDDSDDIDGRIMHRAPYIPRQLDLPVLCRAWAAFMQPHPCRRLSHPRYKNRFVLTRRSRRVRPTKAGLPRALGIPAGDTILAASLPNAMAVSAALDTSAGPRRLLLRRACANTGKPFTRTRFEVVGRPMCDSEIGDRGGTD
jgi:hypothetical protein